MVQLNQAYDKIKDLNAELLAIHVECSEAGTLTTVKRNGIAFPMANDDRLHEYGIILDENIPDHPRVKAVVPQSPAFYAGVRSGDQITGFRGRLAFDASKPSGQRRRCADVSMARKAFGFEASVGLREGLTRTIEWYVREAAAAAVR